MRLSTARTPPVCSTQDCYSLTMPGPTGVVPSPGFVGSACPGPDPTGGCGVDGDRDADRPLPLPPGERRRVGLHPILQI
jgi:hypothetical protein